MSVDTNTLHVLSRRGLLALAPVAAASVFATPARADASADRANAFMTQMIKELTSAVNGPGSTADKAAALQQIIDKAVDVNGIGRFCLGRFWRTASADEQKAYIDLFHKVLVKNITGKVGDYAGVNIIMQKTFSRDDGVVVSTSVERAGNAPAKVDWLLSMDSGNPLVIDVIAEGTSLRLTQRNDYSAFLSSHSNSVTALLDALKQQAS